MKRSIALFFTIILIAALVACSSGYNTSAGDTKNFSIIGTWKNIGDTTHNQIQEGSIISFDGSRCNVVSPQDTYALYNDGNSYKLDCTSILGGTVSYTVKIIDNDNIHLITSINTVIELTRVG